MRPSLEVVVEEEKRRRGQMQTASPISCFLSLPSLFPSPSFNNLHRSPPMAVSARIAVIGDVHGDWDLREDTKALQLLQPDLVLFTGDFGEENVELVQSIADLKFAKAAILGNHDAWYTPQFSQKEKDGVQLQLECLGKSHVAYRRLDCPQQKLSIVGGRPFSHGGQWLFRKQLLSARYGVKDVNSSAKRIYEAAIGTPQDHLVILLAHNGPSGLGSRANDICGKDWVSEAGDHGDEDLAQAISLLKATGKFHVPLVVFGHMHKELAYRRGQRKMIVVGDDNTIYLNGAVVPRVHRFFDEEANKRNFTSSESSSSQPISRGTKRAFTVIDISDGKVDKITESWISVVGDKTNLEEEHVMYIKSANGNSFL